MRFDPDLAAIRFGCGLSPAIATPASAAAMLDLITGPDRASARFAIPGFGVAVENHLAFRDARQALRRAKTDAERDAASERVREARRDATRKANAWLSHLLLRRALSEDGFRERLAAFWADHFTALERGGVLYAAHAPYAEEAIRPHLAGRFSDMLRAVATHPLMLRFLDQDRSIGPNSRAAKKRPGRGLNENLAREIMELHTLGVGAPYSQQDVRELAKLLTGLSYGFDTGFRFRPDLAEPGAETVLAVSYGEGKARLDDIHAALDDLARHPDTARHIARKLAVHFVSDSPDEGLIGAMAARFIATDGDLAEVYAEMLEHPAAWAGGPGNVKQPMDFLGSALRALGVVPRHLSGARHRRMRMLFHAPLAQMGQRWGQPAGPDGWPEADADWITPQRLAARIQWAMTAPFALLGVLPDPRDFVETALGRFAPEPVRFAACAAETRAEGIGTVLASPAFQRM